MAWIHLRLRPPSLGKRKNEIIGFSSLAGFSFGREPPEHSVVAAEEVAELKPVDADAEAAALIAVEAALLGAVEAELAVAALTDAAKLLPAPELLAPMAA